jgi:hypothetical protein
MNFFNFKPQRPRKKTLTKSDRWLDQAGSLICWTMTGLLAFLAGHSMSITGEGVLAISGSGMADRLIFQAIILCPATPIRWSLRAVVATILALVL